MKMNKNTYVASREYISLNGTSHNHILQLGDGVSDFWYDVEDAATELAEAVENCNMNRHNGHGFLHTKAEVEEAFGDACEQLLTKSFYTFELEALELAQKIRAHKKWGGTVPKAVMFPDQDNEWRLLTTDDEGDPTVHRMNPKYLGDIVPAPNEKFAVRDKEGVGWLAKRRLRAKTKLGKIHNRSNLSNN